MGAGIARLGAALNLPEFGISEFFDDPNKQTAGTAIEGIGTGFNLPEFGISESVAGGATPLTGSTPDTRTFEARTQQFAPLPPQPGTPDSGQDQGFRDPDFGDPNNPDLSNPVKRTKYEDFLRNSRTNTQSAAQKALEAAINVFNVRSQGARNRIPGLREAGDLRKRGLSESEQQFFDTAEREQGGLIEGLEQTGKETTEGFDRAERKTRASAKGLARQLRNLFAGAGTLDSTQFRDFNVEQSKEILQSLGDIRTSSANKAAGNLREQDDIRKFFSEKKIQFKQDVALKKDQIQQEVDTNVQGILDDIDLNDAQKIEQVVAQQNQLQERLFELDKLEIDLTREAEKDAQETAIKLAELRNKGTSSSFKASQNDQKAIQNVLATISKLEDQNIQLSTQDKKALFVRGGVDEELAETFLFTGGSSTNNNLDDEISARLG